MRTATLAALLVALAGCSTKTEPTPRGTTDQDRLQGVWAVESVESGSELTPEERKRLMDSHAHVKGNRFSFGEGDDWEFSTFAPDEGQAPKRLMLYESDADGKPPGSGKGIPKPQPVRRWIYKLDGDKLALAYSRSNDPNASLTDFKAEPGRDVVVLQLARTNEEPRTKWDVKSEPAGKKK